MLQVGKNCAGRAVCKVCSGSGMCEGLLTEDRHSWVVRG